VQVDQVVVKENIKHVQVQKAVETAIKEVEQVCEYQWIYMMFYT
jgi:hypothetical protein